jgi:hypothetical protein
MMKDTSSSHIFVTTKRRTTNLVRVPLHFLPHRRMILTGTIYCRRAAACESERVRHCGVLKPRRYLATSPLPLSMAGVGAVRPELQHRE